jgi:hypothetical protein
MYRLTVPTKSQRPQLPLVLSLHMDYSYYLPRPEPSIYIVGVRQTRPSKARDHVHPYRPPIRVAFPAAPMALSSLGGVVSKCVLNRPYTRTVKIEDQPINSELPQDGSDPLSSPRSSWSSLSPLPESLARPKKPFPRDPVTNKFRIVNRSPPEGFNLNLEIGWDASNLTAAKVGSQRTLVVPLANGPYPANHQLYNRQRIISREDLLSSGRS